MGEYAAVTLRLTLVLIFNGLALSQPAGPNDYNAGNKPVELARYEDGFSSARLEPARMGQYTGVAVIFEGADDLHYYAKAETAPAAGFELKVKAKSDKFEFGKAIFPKWHLFTDGLGNKVEVYSGRFTVFVPIKSDTIPAKAAVGDVEVKISGIACTSTACLPPFEKILRARIDISSGLLREISFETTGAERETVNGPAYSIWFALLLAFLAGLALNIMPCIWPVLPIIVMRLVGQAKQMTRKSVAIGFAFCSGILLFFACLAFANIILKIFYGTVLQWGDQFRSPIFLGGMTLLLVVLAMFMFGVFSISLPSSITAKTAFSKGYSGAIGMGFLAAILSTPCSFGILAASFGWAQAQRWPLATLAILFIGAGMAAPYAILTSMPSLLKRLPKSGRWMELFKQGVGFVLLIIAVKLVSALPETRRIGILYFSVVLAFCVWMWCSWVDYKRLIRVIAVVLAVAGGWIFLRAPASQLIDWQNYDTDTIEKARAEGRPVLIKFTADWCFSCQAAEKIVYSRQDIAKLIEQKGVLAIKADTTEKNSPATIALKNIYKEPGVPVSMLFVPGRQEPLKWRGILFAGDLKKALENISP